MSVEAQGAIAALLLLLVLVLTVVLAAARQVDDARRDVHEIDVDDPELFR